MKPAVQVFRHRQFRHMRNDGLERLAIKPSTSLRATGPRECAPDDRLREAIQDSGSARKTGLRRRKDSSQ
jgi:hypothetical protein